MAWLFPILGPHIQATNAGTVLDSANLYFYDAGTTNEITVYSQQDEGATLTNPVVSDSNGYFEDIWIGDSPYKAVLKTSDDTTVWTIDNIVDDTGDDRALTDGGTGASTAIAALDNLFTQGDSIASATTVDLSAATGPFVTITGTTTITGFSSQTAGNIRLLKFAGALTFTHNSSSLILPGASNITTAAGDTCMAVSLGSGNWQVVWYTVAAGESNDLVNDTSPQLGGDLDANSNQIKWAKGADVASATALPVLTDGNYFDVTGTTTIETIDTCGGDGTIAPVIKLHFDAALTLTHHSTNLILPGGANITTAAGDEAEFIEYASGDWRCTNYSKAAGTTATGAQIETGSYTGDGATSQEISLSGSFTPKYVKIWAKDTTPGNNFGNGEIWETTSEILDDDASGMGVVWRLTNTLFEVDDDGIIAFGAGSFTVDDNGADSPPNTSSQAYNYMAIG